MIEQLGNEREQSLCVLPWTTGRNAIAQVYCNIVGPCGSIVGEVLPPPACHSAIISIILICIIIFMITSPTHWHPSRTSALLLHLLPLPPPHERSTAHRKRRVRSAPAAPLSLSTHRLRARAFHAARERIVQAPVSVLVRDCLLAEATHSNFEANWACYSDQPPRLPS